MKECDAEKRCGASRGRAQLESFVLLPWASRRRQDLLDVLDRLNPTIDELSTAVELEAQKRPEVLRLMAAHPGVGPPDCPCPAQFVLVIGSTKRFACGKQIGSYLGLIPCEDSSANRQRLGHISKQGNTLLRFLLVEAAQAACPLRRGVATEVFTPGHAAGSPDRQGSHGAQTRCQFVLEVAQGMELRPGCKVRFARGRVRKTRPWGVQ